MARVTKFHVFVFGVLAIMAAVQVTTMANESQTWDEALTLAAGYSALKTGDLRLIPEHPPLGKYLNALPLLILNPPLPLDRESWANSDGVRFGDDFLYRNGVCADRLLFWGRMMTVLTTVAVGIAVAWWARRRFGSSAAALALVLFAFDPTVIAHGRYATSDMVVTLFSFLACVFWGEYLITWGKRFLIAAGVCLGLALTSKFSALFLPPAFLLLGILRPGAGFWRMRVFGSFLLALAIAGIVIVAVYAPEAKRLVPGSAAYRSARSLRSVVDQSTTAGRMIAWTGARLGLRAHSFPIGIAKQAAHNQTGHAAYLFGRRSQTGWWYFFPVAFVLKAPIAVLLALPLGAAVLAMRGKRPWAFDWYVLGVPAILYLAIAMLSHINIGIRHLLPVYPILAILLGASIAGFEWRYRRPAAITLATLLIIESAAIYPHYLAFFNVLAGGPDHGPRLLVDSNIDWGQDVLKLRSYLRSRGNPPVCVAYFGRADLWYYGIEYQNLPKPEDLRGRAEMNCLVAISATALYGSYGPEDTYAWLRSQAPVDKIGYSIYIYDYLRK